MINRIGKDEDYRDREFKETDNNRRKETKWLQQKMAEDPGLSL
jgi:hypothetical protein